MEHMSYWLEQKKAELDSQLKELHTPFPLFKNAEHDCALSKDKSCSVCEKLYDSYDEHDPVEQDDVDAERVERDREDSLASLEE